jgi:hypothetical protein
MEVAETDGQRRAEPHQRTIAAAPHQSIQRNSAMNIISLMLAQQSAFSGTGEFLSRSLSRMDILSRPSELLDALSQLPLIGASVIVVIGALCVLNGYRWHKWVVVGLAFILGIGLGHLLSAHVGNAAIVAIAVGLLCAIIATPMLKITVAIFAGLTGAFIGANVWAALGGTPPDTQWAGAAMGFILLAMSSLVLFKLVIVLFTSVGGAAMVVLGSITLLLHVPAWEQAIREALTTNHVLIPLLLCVAAVAGFVLQQGRLREDGGKAE